MGKRGFGLTSVWQQTRRGKRRTGRAGAGWQNLDLLKAGYNFERDLGLNCLLLSQCIIVIVGKGEQDELGQLGRF